MFSRLFLVMTLVTAILGGVFWWYYKDTQKTIAAMQQNQAKLELAAKVAEDTIRFMETNNERLNQELVRVNEEFTAIRAQNDVLAGKLEKHDLGVLAAAKPVWVGKIVNNATQKAGRCIELLSGAELTEAEKAATTAKKFNSECPWLWPGGEK